MAARPAMCGALGVALVLLHHVQLLNAEGAKSLCLGTKPKHSTGSPAHRPTAHRATATPTITSGSGSAQRSGGVPLAGKLRGGNHSPFPECCCTVKAPCHGGICPQALICEADCAKCPASPPAAPPRPQIAHSPPRRALECCCQLRPPCNGFICPEVLVCQTDCAKCPSSPPPVPASPPLAPSPPRIPLKCCCEIRPPCLPGRACPQFVICEPDCSKCPVKPLSSPLGGKM